MKYIIIYVAAVFLLPALLYSQEKFGYVGVETCTMCHKTEKQGSQLSIWQKSEHSKAYEVLKTAEADKIAKDNGFNTPAAKTEACLSCHVSGYNADATLLGKKFKMEDGVQCETCHGPGSAYKDMKIMKDRELSVKNGLKVYEKVEELCVKCHNEKSPTFKKMDFATAWEKIKHPTPGKK